MKKFILGVLIFAVVFFGGFFALHNDNLLDIIGGGSSRINDTLADIMNTGSGSAYAVKTVTSEDLTTLLYAGISAPGVQSKQSVHISIISDYETVSSLVSLAAEGCVLLVISASTEDEYAEMRCGQVIENIFIGATSMGMQANLFTSPAKWINSHLHDSVGMPAGHDALAVMLIGYPAEGSGSSQQSDINIDAFNNMVTYVE